MTELLDQGADPTQLSSEARTPYSVAGTKAARDAFRRHMGAHPDQWDWAAAGVPSALTPELQAHQAARQVPQPCPLPYPPLVPRASRGLSTFIVHIWHSDWGVPMQQGLCIPTVYMR